MAAAGPVPHPDPEVGLLEAQLEAMASLDEDGIEVLERLASVIFPERTGYGDPSRTIWPEARPAGAEDQRGESHLRDRLQRMEKRLFTLVEQLPAVVFLAALGEEENEVYVSPQVETLLGFSQEEWLSNPLLWYSQLHPDDHQVVIDAFTAGVHTGGPFRAEVRFFTRDGRTVWIFGEALLIRDSAGRPEYFQGVGIDVTASKEAQLLVAEAERRRADAAEAAAEARSSFLATMSHELRTPMNSVLVLAGLLADTELDAAQQEMLDTLGVAASHLLSLIDDILDYSRLRAGRVELHLVEMDVADWAGRCVEIVAPRASEKGLRLHHRIEGDVPPVVLADDGRLRQVLLNLLGNAVKFTAAGEIEVVVSAERAGPDRWILSCRVRDTGTGIPEGDLDAIFGEFAQADSGIARTFGGAGLGLSISRSLLELMGGSIEVASAVGVGTTFTFRWEGDAVAEPSGRATAPDGPVAAVPSDLRILLVEDDAMNRRVAVLLLEAMGFRADLAVDGDEAVAVVASTAYDVVLMDMMMPGIDGVTAARRIRELGDAIEQPYLVAVTANALPGDREACLAAGMDDYLTKPIDRRALLAALERSSVPIDRDASPVPVVDDAGEVDASVARSLLDLHGSAALGELIGMFADACDGALGDLRAAQYGGSAETAQRAAHTLKSSARLLGAQVLAAACADIEERARAGRFASVTVPDLDALAELARRALGELRALLGE